MNRDWKSWFRRPAAQYLVGGIGLALVTLVCLQLHLNIGTTGFAYLILIALLSLLGSFIGSIVLSVIAVALLNYFFAPPLFDPRMDYAEDILAVAAFWTTSIIVAGLTQKVRKAAEEARASQKALVDTLPALVWSTLPDGSLDFINRRWQELGLSLQDLQGSEWETVIHPEERAGVIDKWRTAVESGMPYENIERVRRADGEYRWFLSRAVPLRDQSGKIVKWYGTDTDIEDRKRAEEALRESEQRFRDYAETASDWLWETGPDHRFLRVSDHVDRSGVAPPKRIGLIRWHYATDLESEPEKWRLHWATLDARRPFRDFVFNAARGDGSTIFIQSSGKPFFDANGDFLGYRGVSTDITAAVRANQAEQALRKAQVELAHVTRLTALGQLTASITHEVNQPLGALIAEADACLRWLDHRAPNLEEARQNVERIIKNGHRAGEVIRRVRSLSKRADPQMVPLDINDVVNEVIALVQREVHIHQVTLQKELAPALPAVLADRVQLQQVLINLLINGLEAMQAVTDRTRELVIRSHRDGANQVLVSVKDSGIGISAGNADQLFNAFFTTKSGGMGMGLSICRSIIEAHRGRLSASGNVGPGATFQFALPAYRPAGS
jgi:PAS domain S-box-containing protein